MSMNARIAAIYLKFLPFQAMVSQKFNAVSVKATMSARSSPPGASDSDRGRRSLQLPQLAVAGNRVFPELLDDRVPGELFICLLQVLSLKNRRLFRSF